MVRAIKLPKNGMPNNWLLKQIAFPPPQSYFHPYETVMGNEADPLISKRLQHQIRKVCIMAGLDPVAAVGLPKIKPRPRVECIPQMPKGQLSPEEQVAYDKYLTQEKIEENMASMQEKIKEFREKNRNRQK